ncbi:PTS sugar transporter subunit IIA [Streptococcus dentasini]
MSEIQASLKDVVSKNLIFLDDDFQKPYQVLDYISTQAKKHGYIDNRDSFLTAVQEREREVATAIGYLVAIPHGKTSAVTSPFIAFMRLKHMIHWGDEPVRLVFLIGVPESEAGKLHLRFISQLSKRLLDEEFRNRLLEQDTLENVYKQLTSIDI